MAEQNRNFSVPVFRIASLLSRNPVQREGVAVGSGHGVLLGHEAPRLNELRLDEQLKQKSAFQNWNRLQDIGIAFPFTVAMISDILLISEDLRCLKSPQKSTLIDKLGKLSIVT